MSLDPNWIAIAQVYATLAVAKASMVIDGTTDLEDVGDANQLIEMAKSALHAAGVQG